MWHVNTTSALIPVLASQLNRSSQYLRDPADTLQDRTFPCISEPRFGDEHIPVTLGQTMQMEIVR
jgi:hypothetical protein